MLASGRRPGGSSSIASATERGSPYRLTALLGFALAVRFVFFGGLLGWDDIEYWEAARALLAGHHVPTSSFGLRYTLTVPLALVQAWLGEHEWVPSLVPLAYSMAHLVLAWALGLLSGGPTVATVAVTLLAILPLDVIAATDLHADLPLAVFLAATVYAVLRGERAARTRWAWFFLAGVALGFGTITKEVGLALLPALALRRWVVPERVGLVTYGWLGAGWLAVTAVEMVWLAAVTGNPLYRYLGPIPGFHAVLMWRQPPGYGWMLGYPEMLLNPLSGYFGCFAGLFYLVVAGTVWGLRHRAPLVAQFAVWWSVLLVLLNFAPLDASFTRPLFHHVARTLHPLLIPFALTVAVWLRDGLAGRRLLRASAAFAVTALSVVGIVATHADYRAWAAVARQAVPILQPLPSDARVVTDPMTASQLRFLLPAWRDRIMSYSSGHITAGRDPVFVLDDPVYLAEARREGAVLPEAMTSPLASWERIAQLDRRPRISLRGILARLLGRDPAPSPPAGAATLWRVGPS